MQHYDLVLPYRPDLGIEQEGLIDRPQLSGIFPESRIQNTAYYILYTRTFKTPLFSIKGRGVEGYKRQTDRDGGITFA